jgi:hypothetical protein
MEKETRAFILSRYRHPRMQDGRYAATVLSAEFCHEKRPTLNDVHEINAVSGALPPGDKAAGA